MLLRGLRTPQSARRLLILAVLVGGTFLLSGCSVFSSPQNTFSPAGEVAKDQKSLFVLTMWPALAIMILVEGAILYIMIRYRHRKGDPLPAQVHGNNKLEIGWTLAPAILLAFFVVPTVGGIVDLGRTPKDAYHVDVTGFRFNWLFKYQDPATGEMVSAGDPGVLHLPVAKKIALNLNSPDVIHSFWVPRLAGKTDVVPGRTNHMWLKADETGTFQGQCAELCGTGHQGMRLQVIVQTQEEFDAWLRSEIGPPPEPGTPGGGPTPVAGTPQEE